MKSCVFALLSATGLRRIRPVIKCRHRQTPDSFHCSLAGWPTAGHPAATAANAEVFVRNAFRTSCKHTLYIFEAFDEKNKAADHGAGAVGSVVENHWGTRLRRQTVVSAQHAPNAPMRLAPMRLAPTAIPCRAGYREVLDTSTIRNAIRR